MEPDDLLCSRNARPQKDAKGAARPFFLAQNLYDKSVVARRAQ